MSSLWDTPADQDHPMLDGLNELTKLSAEDIQRILLESIKAAELHRKVKANQFRCCPNGCCSCIKY